MEEIKAVLLMGSLYMSFITIQYTVNAQIHEIVEDMSNVVIRTIATSILWGLFYYLS